MPSTPIHLHDELAQTQDRVVVKTWFGPITGGRSRNGAAVFLGKGIVPVTLCARRHYLDVLEIPYALPPGRFENPVPLPSGFRYQDRDYITECSCQLTQFDQFRPLRSLSTLTLGQTRYSPQMTFKLLVCADSPENYLEIHERCLILPGEKFEDKVGLGKPTENP
jgi:hypothetical protein